MSHELRTPLTGILGLSEVLLLKIYGELNDKQNNTLKTIEESGRHLLDLINDILDLSKIEAGKLELQFAPCSLGDVCQASLQLVKGMAQQKRQHVHYTPLTEPIIVRADARRLKQMLVNLLSNAIKFSPENGELGLEIEANEPERKLRLTVWDKGIGIKSENLEKLFKPFVQLDSGLAREYSGTGLGLSLVQHLTELHSGGMEVKSKIGEGSRFTIVLPWSPQNTTPIPYLPQRGVTGRLSNPGTKHEDLESPLVMVVDDNEMVLQMVADFLSAKQYRVMKTRSGTELLELAAKFHPDIMLVDIQMPGIGGMETIRRIRSHADPLVAAAPVIAVTALAMPADRERCLRAGANDYMSKPIKLKELAASIQKLLERK
jgi:CheY-like chemotaxis protein